MRNNITNVACIVFVLAFCLLTFACETRSTGTGHYTNGFKYSDPVYQEEIVSELKRLDVPIIIANDGYATYPDDQVDKVNRILKKIDNSPFAEFYKPEYADNFSLLLEENNIDYRVKYFPNNKVQIYWDDKHDTFVRDLKTKNLNKIFGR